MRLAGCSAARHRGLSWRSPALALPLACSPRFSDRASGSSQCPAFEVHVAAHLCSPSRQALRINMPCSPFKFGPCVPPRSEARQAAPWLFIAGSANDARFPWSWCEVGVVERYAHSSSPDGLRLLGVSLEHPRCVRLLLLRITTRTWSRM